MTRYTIDTNVFVDALREPAEMVALKAFLEHALPTTSLSAVVLAELIAGTSTEAQRQAIESQLTAPFVRRGRLFAPSAEAWRTVGRVAADLRRTFARGVPASLGHDLLLAASCREHGIVVITRDTDFSRMARHVPGLRVAAPFPKRS